MGDPIAGLSPVLSRLDAFDGNELVCVAVGGFDLALKTSEKVRFPFPSPSLLFSLPAC
jgi:hypothetical protein